MSKFLKGNYQLNTTKPDVPSTSDKNFSEVFEDEALKKLGGSIAFVMKSKKFMWDDDDDNAE
jgi:hypothetical protein